MCSYEVCEWSQVVIHMMIGLYFGVICGLKLFLELVVE